MIKNANKNRASDCKYRNVIHRALKSVQKLSKRDDTPYLAEPAYKLFKARLGF